MRGAATDWRGYTVKTQLNPYDENRVAISDNYFSKSNIELDNTVVTMVPTRGAVVKAEFVTHVGYRVLFRVLNANGKPVPFGAIAAIQDASLADSGIVGDRGELYLLVYQKRTGYVITGRKRLNKMHLQLFTFDTRK